MIWLIGLALAAFVLWLVFRGGDKPTELNPSVFVADSVERAKRLADATAAWREGRTYTPPEAVDHWRATGVKPLADPNAELPPRRLVRDHPMRAPRWK